MQDLAAWLQKHLSIAYVPGHEFFLSLHVLANPDHHTSRLGWAQESLSALPASLVKKLHQFSNMSNQFLDAMDFLVPWEERYEHSVEASLEQLQAMDAAQFAQLMLGPVYHPRQLQQWMQGHTDDLFEQLKPEHRELLRHPLSTKRRFLEFCHAYLPFFRAEERRIEPWLVRAVHEGQERIAADPVGFLAQVHPRLKVHENFLQFHKAQTYTFAYSELAGIHLRASTFVSPHLLLGICGEHISVGFAVDVPGISTASTIPADFTLKMKVFSDPTRTAILKSLLDHPYCTQQLADLHGISEPAVNKHLKLLVEAGFVWSERRGRYVFYRGITSRLEQLAVDLHEFIDMPAPGLALSPPKPSERRN
ncbi:ArsR/SmtB family transcription factor [Brevibacillus agri]|uniref:ArsR/SmtB family transcription factor n=1 Tax=Brevibacillus agri TaxID=51101 RepID=UPI0002A50376|nr:metalloregulator ArsR/SmtB family transcription factor [Brevibacillus agri]ELK39620.1 transcriptional regulator [Brevibacillus agri BAB-2500]MBG9566599.1 transcriptional regulator [Brevibacillus agri]MCG5252004.1 metalloregulator ArsR/SmtB family transcription factor [Brevibacillus agri]MDN4094932.1 metalloregulator ArsR/SmtB family transcription factor [Brevibacillus agri]MDR9506157.1 metalloregulator ArsR/SmtB family transcription factor [Brevibacillus agri]